MLKKTEFLSGFGLGDLAALVPGQRAPWLVPAHGLIPAAWQPELKALDEASWAKWESVLHQPETKRIQKIFLKDLARPAELWQLNFQPQKSEEEGLLPILLPRTEAAESISFHITIPAYAKARVVFIEKAADDLPLVLQRKEEKRNEADASEKLYPNVTISAKLAPYAQLDIAYVHPLYNGEESRDYLKAGEKKHCLYYAEAAEGAQFKWTSVNLGDSLIERGEVHLNGPEAGADVGGAAYVQHGAEQLYQSHIYCHKPYGRCRVHNHGVVENGGTGTFISVSDIDKGAHGTAAREDNRFMTLGDEAKAYADPTLLIDEYDVQASHAATIGHVDEDALFYLQSRGLDKQAASRLMTAGFLTPLFDRIAHEGLREKLLQQFYEKLRLDDMLGKAEDDE